jgi:prepilin-type processing-associated H-X9-DG protein
VPLFSDAALYTTLPEHTHAPPEHADIWFVKFYVDTTMDEVCIDRHSGSVNLLMLDSSVRKVGLKELWTLKWNRKFDTQGPWTKAGGVQPSDWPAWMRNFKDY